MHSYTVLHSDMWLKESNDYLAYYVANLILI